MARVSKQVCLCDCDYNLTKQLAKKLQFLWNAEGYVKDAEKDGHPACAKLWREIARDEERHANLLRETIIDLAKAGQFRA